VITVHPEALFGTDLGSPRPSLVTARCRSRSAVATLYVLAMRITWQGKLPRLASWYASVRLMPRAFAAVSTLAGPASKPNRAAELVERFLESR
jgi:hypothetical protein